MEGIRVLLVVVVTTGFGTWAFTTGGTDVVDTTVFRVVPTIGLDVEEEIDGTGIVRTGTFGVIEVWTEERDAGDDVTCVLVLG